jgi:hypothetical protein
MNHYRIPIVGAGLAGLSLARALRQAGLAPQVIEREPSWGVAATGMYLPANAVGERRSLPGPAPDRAAPDSPRGRTGTVGPHHPVAGEPRRARPGRLRRRQWWRLRLGRRGRWAALHGPAAGRRPAAAGLRRPAQLAVPGRGTSFLTVRVGQGLVYAYADVTADSEPVGDPIGRLRQRFAGFAAGLRGRPGAGHLPARRCHGHRRVAAFVARRSRRTGWVRSQTHRRANYRPLLEPI